MQGAVFVHDEFLHVGLLAVGVGDHDVIAAREGGGGSVGVPAAGLEGVHTAADVAGAVDIAVGLDPARDAAALEAGVGAGEAAVRFHPALECGHAGLVARAVQGAVFIHDEFLHVGLLAVGVGNHDVIAAREGGGSGSGGRRGCCRGSGRRGGLRGRHGLSLCLGAFRRRVGLHGQQDGHDRRDHQQQRGDDRGDFHRLRDTVLAAGNDGQHDGQQGQGAEEDLGHQQGRLPPGGDPLDGGAAGDAVHGVGVNHGVQDAVSGLPHAPGHVGVAGAALVQMLRLHHAVHQVSSGDQHGRHVHVGGCGAVPHVGDHNAGHAAFVAEELCHHAALHAAPVVAHAVEGQHDGGSALEGLVVVLGARDGDGQFEGPHVDLADGLLVGPDADAAAQVLLVVEAHVLVVDIEAMAFHGGALIGADHAGEVAVLGVILEVAAGVGGALDVAAGAVEAVVSGPEGILADEVAHGIHQVRVEGGRQNAARGVAHGLGVLVRVVGQGGQAAGTGLVGLGQAGGAVVIQGFHLVDGGDLPGAAHAGGDDLGDLLPGQLIQQRVPHGIVVGNLVAVGVRPKLNQAQGMTVYVRNLAEDRVSAVVGGQLRLALLAELVLIRLELFRPVEHHMVVPALRGGALPVGAAHVGHRVAAAVLVLVPVGILKLVGDLIAGSLAGSKGFPVQSQGDFLGDQGGLALGIHAAVGGGGAEALLRQNVVDGVMCVAAGGQVVVAVHDDVGLRVLAVVGGKLPLLDGDDHSLAFAGGEQLRLCEARQLHAGRLDAVLPVILAVGLLEVDLHDLLAGSGAIVGDLHAHIVHRVRTGAGLLHGVIGIAEVGVALAVAEGIADRGRVVKGAGFRRAHDVILIAALRVAVAQVDALLIHHVPAVLLLGAVVVHRRRRALVRLGAEVGQGGVLVVIRPEGRGEAAGGVHLAGKDVADRVHADLAGGADPQRGVHAVLRVIQEGGLHLVGEVEDDDDLFDGSGVLLCLQAPEQRLLVGAELQVVAVHGVAQAAVHVVQLADGILAAGHVAALAAQAGDEHQRRVAVLGKAGVIGRLHRVPGRFADGLRAGHAAAGGAGGAAVAGLLLGGIPVPEGFIDAEIAAPLKGSLPARRGGDVHIAAAGAAVDGIDGGDGEEAQPAAGSQWQSAVLILQKDDAFRHGFLGGLAAGGHQAVQIAVSRLEILSILVAGVLRDLPEGGGLQEAGDLRGVFPRDDGADHEEAEEEGQHRHRNFEALRFDRHGRGGRDGIHDQAGRQKAHHDEEGSVPRGVDAHEGRADVGIEGVHAQRKGRQVGQRHDVCPEARLLHKEDQHSVCRCTGCENPHGRPGHAVHAPRAEAVERGIDGRGSHGQNQPDDCEGALLVFHDRSLLIKYCMKAPGPSLHRHCKKEENALQGAVHTLRIGFIN